ncbi:MAG: hypothetical protein WC848_02870 [Parcubacteria group bacterium]|jgi:hypothetical protein
MTIDSLSRSLARGVARHVVLRGKGGPLIFLVVLGSGLIGIASMLAKLGQFFPLMEGGFLIVCFLAGYVIYREGMHDLDTRRSALECLVWQDFPIDEEKLYYRPQLLRGLELGCEAIHKLLELSRRSEEKESLSQILDDAIKMLEMQHDSVCQVREARRILALVSDSQDRREKNDPLLAENIRAMGEYATEAESLIGDINDRLKTVTLQIAQLETRTSQRKVNATTFAKENSDMLKKLQSAVERRKSEAAVVIQKFQYN